MTSRHSSPAVFRENARGLSLCWRILTVVLTMVALAGSQAAVLLVIPTSPECASSAGATHCACCSDGACQCKQGPERLPQPAGPLAPVPTDALVLLAPPAETEVSVPRRHPPQASVLRTRADSTMLRVAIVPLFRRHCAFLI